MKIKQPNYRCPVDCAADDAEIDVEIPTASLIAELEKRRPCKKCSLMLSSACMSCTWRDVWDMAGLNNHADNFKPAK